VCATVAAIGLLTGAGDAAHGVRGAAVSIDGERFLIDGKVHVPADADRGPAYEQPDGAGDLRRRESADGTALALPGLRAWNAARNTRAFVAALPRYAPRGLRAVTVGPQGGNPVPGHAAMTQPWVVSAYRADGTLKQRGSNGSIVSFARRPTTGSSSS
jgi:hypothetical protein